MCLFFAVSCYSMFPLLFEPKEYPIKVILLAIHSILMWSGLTSLFLKISPNSVHRKPRLGKNQEDRLIGWIGGCYLLSLLAVEIWGQFLHAYIFGDMLPFFPLMLVSLYCAIGMIYSWAWQLRVILKSTDTLISKKRKKFI